jgi:hypothetical protein
MINKQLLLYISGYLLLFILLFNGYKYSLDPDATGYFSVAEKLAKGDFYNSINGIWSPLGSWMLIPFIKYGFNEILSAKILNGFYGAVSLCLYFSLLKKLKINAFAEVTIMIGAVLLMVHFAFSRIFGDLLQVMLLLFYLNIICSKKFNKTYKEIFLAAFIGGIGFYAKAYTFYFVLFHLPILIIFLEKRMTGKYFTSESIKKIGAAITVLLVTVAFWIIALNIKYGHFILGQKNITGTLSQIYAPQKTLIYPPSVDNYAFFDDISYLNLKDITPFTNWNLFIIQIKIIIVNFINLVSAFNDFSFAFSIIILVTLFLIINKKFVVNEKNTCILLSFILIWPCGYLLFTIQTRFLWIMDLAVLSLAGILLSELMKSNFFKRKSLYIFCCVIIGSFYLYPVFLLKNEYNKGKDLAETAVALKNNHIKGRILTSIQSDADYSKSIILNYRLATKFYGPYIRNYTDADILKAIKDYNINYYFFYYSTPIQKETFVTGNLAQHATSIKENIYPGIVVLSFNDKPAK